MLSKNEVEKLYSFSILSYVSVKLEDNFSDELSRSVLHECISLGKILEYTSDKVLDDVHAALKKIKKERRENLKC